MKTLVKFAVTVGAALLFQNAVHAQNTRVGATSVVPNASSMLEIDGITGLAQAKGVLLPRITQAQRLAMNPLPAAAQGLLVYQTNTVGTSLEGFYYNISITVVPNWVYVVNESAGWLTRGNAGTVAGTNFIGTTDAIDFVTKTGGITPANERLRVLKTGEVVVNDISVQAGDVFSVYGNSTTNGVNANTSAIGDFAINGYSSSLGIGVYGENKGTGIGVMGSSTGTGVYGTTNSLSAQPGVYGENYNAAPGLPANTSAYGVYGYTNRVASGTGGSRAILGLVDAAVVSGGAYGVQGQVSNPVGLGVFGTNLAASGGPVGVQGQAASPNGLAVVGITNTINGNPAAATAGYGVYGQANGPASINGSLIGVRGSTIAAITTGGAIGVYGSSSSSAGSGVHAFNANVSGTGLMAGGNAVPTITYLVAGSGCAVSSTILGGFFKASSVATGTGILAVGNNSANLLPGTGAGVVGSGSQYGVMGFAASNVSTNPLNNNVANGINGSAGGYFEVQNAGLSVAWAYVGVREAAGPAGLRKIIGNGTVNTIVKDLQGEYVSLSCPEAPENFFQDYGTGVLQQGMAHITLDPVFAKNIAVDDQHPLRIFIQLRDDCNGVFVFNENADGFDVKELLGGNSNARFFWTVTANRADEVLSDGTTAAYSKERFSKAPGPLQAKQNMQQAQTSDQQELMKSGEKSIRAGENATQQPVRREKKQLK